ncbi:uncharacterized protein LOC143588429 [Bidens hawaiensis]|uniref:uncharacterized protein LOC143588429 n=1 Tax=Bidens hawaiensis TaxID=980011 RepID=UPI00404A816F
MAPKTRRTSNNQATGLPLSQDELAQLIAQHVNTALEQHEANRNASQNPLNTTNTSNGEAPRTENLNENPSGSTVRGCSYKPFQGCGPREFTGAEGPLEIIRWIEKMDSLMKISDFTPLERIKYGVCSFRDEALECWNSIIQNLEEDAAYRLTSEELKEMLLKEYCPRNELQKIEYEFWQLKTEGDDIGGYTSRFNSLARLVPRLVTPEYARIERYIWGLAPEIRGMVTSSKPTTIQSARELEKSLTDNEFRMRTLKDSGKKATTAEPERKIVTENHKTRELKRKWNGNSEGQFKRNQGAGRMFAASARGSGHESTCKRFGKSHNGECWRCQKCNRFGHQTQYCFSKDSPSGSGKPNTGCFECGNMGHYRKECPKLRNQNVKGRAFEINAKKARKDSSVVTGMFLINRRYAYVLFDTGADLSFVSKQFEPFLGIEPNKLDTKYSIELSNGKMIETSKVVRNCSIRLTNHTFSIDLLPVELGSFDILVGMDWLSKNQAEIDCSEKLIRLPLPSGETLTVQGEQGNSELKLTSIMKTRKMLRKGYPAFLVNVLDTEAEGKKIEDIPIVRDYPEVFPEDLPGLPPPRQVEFRIDLVQDAAPIARSPYRLAPSEMKEL